jgi:hypothetical protein
MQRWQWRYGCRGSCPLLLAELLLQLLPLY